MTESAKSSKRVGLIAAGAAAGLLALSAGGYFYYINSTSPESARIKLQQMGIPYEASAFSDALRKNDETVINLFFQADMPISASSGDTPSILMQAIEAGNLSLLQKAAQMRDTDFNAVDQATGVTPLIAAIFLKKSEILGWLIEQKIDVNVPAEDGISPLEAAILMDNAELIGKLAKAGADLNRRKVFAESDYYNVIQLVRENIIPDDLSSLTQAFKARSSGNKIDDRRTEFTPTLIATLFERHRALNALFENGADVNIRINFNYENDKNITIPSVFLSIIGIPMRVRKKVLRYGLRKNRYIHSMKRIQQSFWLILHPAVGKMIKAAPSSIGC